MYLDFALYAVAVAVLSVVLWLSPILSKFTPDYIAGPVSAYDTATIAFVKYLRSPRANFDYTAANALLADAPTLRPMVQEVMHIPISLRRAAHSPFKTIPASRVSRKCLVKILLGLQQYDPKTSHLYYKYVCEHALMTVETRTALITGLRHMCWDHYWVKKNAYDTTILDPFPFWLHQPHGHPLVLLLTVNDVEVAIRNVLFCSPYPARTVTDIVRNLGIKTPVGNYPLLQALQKTQLNKKNESEESLHSTLLQDGVVTAEKLQKFERRAAWSSPPTII